ncbi:MAG TPA: hypothetical protein VKX17_16700 [Planctomycetota bacterium]|nr:hypothetical protein [Planctomycetota bacterium]
MSAKPDFKNIAKSDARESKFPAPMDTEYRVFFAEAAYDQMKKHTATTNEVELCGVLIGDVYHDSLGFFLKIDAVIEGKDSNNYGAQVTFTHQTWEHINSIKDKQYPNQRIVGWYHTHPGFGVFLSGMDMFIQENTFNHPYQVAVVVETKQNIEGCFAWVDGKSVPLSRYWVGEREIKLATGPAEPFNVDAASGPRVPLAGTPASARPMIDPQAPPSSLLNLLTILMFLVCGFLLGKMMEANNTRTTVMASLESEVYSLLEFAAVNTAASKDLTEISDKLAGVSEKLKQNNTAAADQGLKELSEEIKGLTAVYNKKRSDFHANVTELVNTKQNLLERFATLSQRERVIDEACAMLYYFRITDMAVKNGAPVDSATLTPAEKQELKDRITKAIALAPGIKSIIEEKFPKLFNDLFPEQRAPEQPAPATTTATTPTTTK